MKMPQEEIDRNNLIVYKTENMGIAQALERLHDTRELLKSKHEVRKHITSDELLFLKTITPFREKLEKIYNMGTSLQSMLNDRRNRNQYEIDNFSDEIKELEKQLAQSGIHHIRRAILGDYMTPVAVETLHKDVREDQSWGDWGGVVKASLNLHPGELSHVNTMWHSAAVREMFGDVGDGDIVLWRILLRGSHSGNDFPFRSGYAFDLVIKPSGDEKPKITAVFVTDVIPDPIAVLKARESGILLLDHSFNPIRVAQFTTRRGKKMMVSYVDGSQGKNRK